MPIKAALNYLKKRLVRNVTSLLITLLFLAHTIHISGFVLPLLNHIENIAYDFRVNLTMPGDTDERIVIIDIDEKSLAKEGRWPWNRKRISLLIDILFDHYHIGLLGMDVVWAERDESSGLKVLEALAKNELRDNASYRHQLDRLRSSLNLDQIFVESFNSRPIVLGYYFDTGVKTNVGNTSGTLPPPTFGKDVASQIGGQIIEAGGYGANLPELQSAATSAGHFNHYTGSDGIVRKIPMLIEFNNAFYASLTLAITELIFGKAEATVYAYTSEDKPATGVVLESIKIGDRSIPVDEAGRALIPYRGKVGSFTYIPATDILSRAVNPEVLKGTIALLGTSAPGLVDLRSTPVSSNMPGVELHANMISGILDQTIKNHPQYTLAIEFLLMLFAGLIMTLLLPANRPVLTCIITLLLISSVCLVNLYFWEEANQVLQLAPAVTLILILFVFNMSYGFFVEARTKRQLTGLFSQYVPKEQVRKMSRNPENFSQEGESRNMTVLFSDVRDFTSISENLKPIELHQLMNEYLTPITEVIHIYDGTIDKYMGDAVMAFWGAPLDDELHAYKALLAAMDMLTALQKINEKFKRKGWPELRVGIGINTGEMIVGDMGSKFRRAYTVMGDAVNLGSRLEGLTKQYGVTIIISEFTRRQLPKMICRELDIVRVKGKERPVVIYQPIAIDGTPDTEVLEALDKYHLALKAFRAQNWSSATELFQELHECYSDQRLYKLYLERIDCFKTDPPGATWDGIYSYKTK